MKTTFNTRIRSYALLILFCAPFLINSQCKAYNETRLYELVEEFLDLNRKKTFAQFVVEFNLASQGKPELNELRNKLAEMKDKQSKNPMALALLIKKHSTKFPQQFKKLIESKGPQVLTILKNRLNA